MGLLIFAAKGYESYGALVLEAGVHSEIDDVLSVEDERKFEVHCNADAAGELQVGTESLSVKIGQRILRDGTEEMWDSVMIHGDQAADGSLEIRVMVFHPDWEQGRVIACIRSRPSEKRDDAEMLTFDLVHRDA